MEQAVDYLESQGIVHIKTSFALTLEAVKKLGKEALSTGRQHGVHSFLVDGRDSQLELSILEIDDLPAMFKDMGVGFDDRIAVLYNALSPKSSLFLFFQNVSFLRLLQFRVFSDEDKALAWLKSGSSKSQVRNNTSREPQH